VVHVRLVARVSGVFLLVALLLSIAQSATLLSVYAQSTVSPGCPGGFIDAVLILRDSLYRLYQLALSLNASLPGDLVQVVSMSQNLSRETLASMPSSECRALYSDLNRALRNMTGVLGIYLEPQARGAYERATLRAVERLLERARDLNMSDLYSQALERLRSGNISIKDLEDLDKRIEAREFEAKAGRIRVIVRNISEDAQYRLKDLSRAADEISKAEEILERVRDLLVSVNASPRAIEAIDQAIGSVRKAREAVEEERRLSEIERINASISKLENQIRVLLSTINSTGLENTTASRIAGLLQEALRRLSEARDRLGAGNISEALSIFEEAYSLYKKAREAFEDAVKKIGEAEDLLERYREAMRDLGDLRASLEKIKMRYRNITDTQIRIFIDRIEAMISEAMNISSNILELIKAGRLGDAKKALEILEARIKEISKMMENLEEAVERMRAKAREIEEEAREIRARALEELARYQKLRASMGNATSQQVREMIDRIQKAFEDLNKTLSELDRAIATGNLGEAVRLLGAAKGALEQIVKLIDMLESMARGRK